MSYSEFHKEALEKRGLALLLKRFAIKMRDDALAKKNELNAVLFGEGGDYGILSVAQVYYRLLWLGTGKETKTPVLNDMQNAKSQYIAQLEKSVIVEGDGENGLHPPDPDTPSAGQEKVNENSAWLTGFSLEGSPSGTGIVQCLDLLLEQIGKEASNNVNGRGPYATSVLAQAQIASAKGSGILGLRTENSELQGTEGAFTVGINGIDKPDTFSSKTDFMRSIQNLTGSIQAWKDQLANIKALLENGGKILSEYKIEKPDADLENIEPLREQADRFMQKLNDYAAYFEAFPQTDTATNSSNRSAFNDKLNELKNYTSEVRDGINERCDAIPGLMGDAGGGMRKHLAFWVSEAAQKPDGPYAIFQMAEAMIANGNNKLAECNKKLNFFEQDKTKWIESPSSIAAYNVFIKDLDETIKKVTTVISWGAVRPANKYKVLIKKQSELFELNNAPWDESGGVWVTEAQPETGFAKCELEIEPPKETIFIRVIAYDTSEGNGDLDRMDNSNTRSSQSQTVGDEIPFTQKDDRDGKSVLSIDKSFGIKENQFLILDNGIARVSAVSEDLVQLDKDYDTVRKVQKIFGMYEPEGL